ncbi:hypothetical protein [Providencia rettgeri]|uniref:hypothetical protein n=1 Tax=Providencia rettgeri TaxID=587 RepID=UPI00235EAA02|nr:hypothetical protein [Providencia rettgeri]ELR5153093.1 SMI1/KNR4 family protein [Providencia rettgeri]
MSSFTDKLLSICSDDISPNQSKKCIELDYGKLLIKELGSLLEKKNGFYGFESALHVFPYESIDAEMGLIDWNKHDLWIAAYKDMALGAFFFAEDIFGNQFCIKDDLIQIFDPETGSFDQLAANVDEWSKVILVDYDFLTGYSLANQWQNTYGKIQPMHRLVPKIPFVLGGEYTLENLYLSPTVESLKFRASLALQIRDIPDGVSISIDTEN